MARKRGKKTPVNIPVPNWNGWFFLVVLVSEKLVTNVLIIAREEIRFHTLICAYVNLAVLTWILQGFFS